jgi:hypothetical protein
VCTSFCEVYFLSPPRPREGVFIYIIFDFFVYSFHKHHKIVNRTVSRLSGTTAEFVAIWLAITCKLKPFYIDNEDKKLYLKLSPKLPSWLFDKNGLFEFKFLGNIKVVYINKTKKNTFGSNCARVVKMKLIYNNGN